MMDTAAPKVDPPSTPRLGAAACPARIEDCWCGEPGSHPEFAHMCAAPGCGAIWDHDGEILRLPGWSSLRYQRTGLRVA